MGREHKFVGQPEYEELGKDDVPERPGQWSAEQLSSQPRNAVTINMEMAGVLETVLNFSIVHRSLTNDVECNIRNAGRLSATRCPKKAQSCPWPHSSFTTERLRVSNLLRCPGSRLRHSCALSITSGPRAWWEQDIREFDTHAAFSTRFLDRLRLRAAATRPSLFVFLFLLFL